MFAANYLNYLKSICLVVIIGCLFTSNSFAQDASTAKGFQPGNSFSIGDFETINTTNGNLMFKFPLANLPSGRNGLTAGINLYYSSKVLDSEIRYFDKVNSCVHNSPDCPYYKKLLLRESDDGGWHFGMGYSLKVIDRREQFVNIPIELQPTCSTSDPRYFEMRYHIKLILSMPDGSTHEMRPNGWSDGNFNDPLGDYFEISPDGFWFNCHTSTWYTNTITYYSIDGSYLRLDIQHDGNTAGGWQDNPWTLYFPDGSKVTTNQPNNEPQRFYDRNNNYVEFDGNTIRDQFNRSISIGSGTQNGVPVQTVTSQGFGETLTWTIRWKTISVLKNYWPCQDVVSCDPEITQQEPYGWARGVIDTITMPAQAGGLTYTFTYNAPDYVPSQGLSPSSGWGEINGVTLPSGAHIDYQYFQDGSQPQNYTPDILRNSPITKVLTYNQEYDGTSTPVTETWNYGINQWGSVVIAPDGGTTGTEFFDTTVPSWSSGLTYKSLAADGTLTETIWARNDLATGIAGNPYPKTVFSSIKNAAGSYVKTSIKDYKYDKNGNITRTAEYDWLDYQSVPRDGVGLPTGIPAGASPTRVTVNTYFNSTPDATQFAGSNTNVYWSSGSPRMKNAIASGEMRRILAGGTEDPVTRVESTYDNPATTANLTQSRTWDSTKGSYTNPLTTGNSLTATTQYNQYGMPTLITDARGLKTFTTYGLIGAFSDLYPTQVKSAYQTTEERTETREYDFGTGLTTRVTDTDNNVATATSFDALGRPVLVRAAEGRPEEVRTTTEYSESARRVITRSDLTTLGDGKVVSIQHYDQLGRVRLTRQLEDSAQSATDETIGIKTQTRYQYSGSNNFLLVSNPYRAATSGAAGSEPTMGWTRSKSDNAGRMIEVQTFGGASLPAPWGTSTISTGAVITAYDANFTTVTDQAQKLKRTVTDSMGRLIRVDEADQSGNLGSNTSPTQPTNYTYDVLGNLTHVTQSDGTTTQNRDFTYSSLSRLTAATQPETGNSSYKYDATGNLIVKTDDARNVSIHYAYDALNRVTRRWYNGSNLDSATTHNSPTLPASVGATDEVKFYYDSQALPAGAPAYTREYTAGRLVAQIYGTGSNGDYFSYDALGSAKLKYQQIGTVNYRMSAAYNRAGALTSLTYPSDHTIANSFDTAGRLLSLSGNIGTGGASRTYASDLIYTPSGALLKELFGTDTAVYNKHFYNSRGQLAEVRVGTSYTGPTDYTADRGALVNAYSSQCAGICLGLSMTDNNGNLLKQEIHIPSQQMRWQQFEYDSVNRLSWAREVLNGGAEQWRQQFDYDRWGNRTINAGVTYGGINETAFTVNKANNRLGVPAGQSGAMDYDAAGNLINDTYTGAGNRTYDAENKITSAWGGNNQAQLYSYDGSGQRYKRTVNGVTTWQVYGFGGELIAEYAANGPANTPQKEYGYRNGQLLIVASGGTASADPPTSLTAAPVNGGAQVALNWTAASGAVNYRVERKAAGQSFVLATTSTTNSTIDNGASAGNAYLYRVCSANASGICTSAYSNIALGAAISFPTDPTLISIVDDPTGVTVTTPKAGHINELRTAVNAVRTLAAQPPGTWTNQTIASGVEIKKEDITDLRDELGEALDALGISTSPYADPVITSGAAGTLIKKIHITQLRDRSTSGTGGPGGTGVTSALQWLVTDHLGTPRMIIDQTGSNVKRHDYLPFGEELFAPFHGRTTSQGYDAAGDGIRQQFTQQERDVETGLDYFGARYYSSVQGRFISPDPLAASGRSYEPQSWNRYNYVLNRPKTIVDTKGLDWGATEWIDEEGVRHINYHYFEGKVGEYKGRKYTPVNFGSPTGHKDILADDGSVVRISNVGVKRSVIYSPPSGTGVTRGQDDLDFSAGLVRGIPIVGHLADHVGGVNRDSDLYKKGQLMTTSVVVFAAVATGGGGLPGCMYDVSKGITLYRAVTAAELASIRATGNYTLPRGLEGKYFFQEGESASAFSQMMYKMNPKEGPYTITSTVVDKSVIEASAPVKAAGEGPAYYVPHTQLPLGPVRIWNQSPLPPPQ